MTAKEYTRYIQTLKIGRAKGMPTPTLMLAHYSLDEIKAVHSYFGLKVIAVNPAKLQNVIELNTSSKGVSSLHVTNGFNWKNFSNRIFPRPEPYFNRQAQKMNSLLNTNSARVMTIVPASIDSYFRFKTLRALSDSKIGKDSVSAVIGRFHCTNFGAWVLIIEKAQMQDGSSVNLSDFELSKLKQG